MSLSPGIQTLAIDDLTRRAASAGYASATSLPPVDFVGRDPGVREVVELAKQVADTAATVLITGESGSGKEVLAQIIRRHSGPRSEPFVAVNCGAIPESLQESEFFGHVKGAFTGAVERKTGKLERANGGTIFLDEISAMSKSLQAALLRTLQSGEYSPVGSSETRFCNVRVIAAANRNLLEMIDAGEFRRDLYYRLNIIRLEIPPLRQRKGDIPELCHHFAQTLGAKYGKPGLRISPEAIQVLMTYDFPGNVRELENFLGRAAILCRGGVIEREHLPAEVTELNPQQEILEDLDDFQSAKARAVEKFERAYLTAVLQKCGGIISRASSYSGLSERNFHEKLKRYQINAKSFRGPARD
ncbi:MAG: sigma-54-dependent Fis family transcriptional regulator [Bryobacterales bacterium]|nr:sigma-54-dependent Fis family transcriptional regulator [Bryobacterales bacterium]